MPPLVTPRIARLPRVAADADLHAVALALDAPALVERGDASRERWHVVPLLPREWLWAGGSRVRESRAGVLRERDGRALDALRQMLSRVESARPSEDIPFAGGLFVLLSYDLGHEIERLPATTERRDDIPWLVAVACAASLLVPVGGGEALLAWMPSRGAGSFGLDDTDGVELALRCEQVLRDPVAAARGKEARGRPAGPVTAAWTQDDHEAAVREVIENLRAGEIYQANLTQRFECAWQGSALPLHGVLRLSNPSPFSGWMRDPEGAWEVVSGSPERLVRRTGAELVTEPIKGTVPLPRGPLTTSEEAATLAARLLSSAKDHAEHVMIVDLHRNDLGRVSAPGTVRVEQMMRLDRRSHVIQAIADIRGILAPGAGPVEIIEALFPGGSVTGVPKIRAMEIIDSLERFDRGPYTGSFGFIAPWGDMDLNILIRSAWRSGPVLAFAAGGGIVLDSDPTLEYRESLAKAEALRQAIEVLRAEGA